jgi:hypothetical protein
VVANAARFFDQFVIDSKVGGHGSNNPLCVNKSVAICGKAQLEKMYDRTCRLDFVLRSSCVLELATRVTAGSLACKSRKSMPT